MSSYYAHYKSNKPTVRTNSKEHQEAVRRYEQALERRNQYLTTTSNNKNHYKTVLLLVCGGLIVGLGVLIYSVGYKLGKSKCKYKRYSS